MVDVDYDIRGTIRRYVRSCQPLHQCTHLTEAGCTRGKCCSRAPDRCLCRPGNQCHYDSYIVHMDIVTIHFCIHVPAIERLFCLSAYSVKFSLVDVRCVVCF